MFSYVRGARVAGSPGAGLASGTCTVEAEG